MVTSIPIRMQCGSIPDFAEPVEAWRVWRVALREGGVVLQSLFAGAVWEPYVPFVAVCPGARRPSWAPWRTKPAEHTAPELDCRCGVYGVRSVVAARSYLELPPLLFRNDRVLGRVALWGDVVEGPSGWRASHAYPLDLVVPASLVSRRGVRRRAHADVMLSALEGYGVPVEVVARGALPGYAVGA
jgi:hypothetical protein